MAVANVALKLKHLVVVSAELSLNQFKGPLQNII